MLVYFLLEIATSFVEITTYLFTVKNRKRIAGYELLFGLFNVLLLSLDFSCLHADSAYLHRYVCVCVCVCVRIYAYLCVFYFFGFVFCCHMNVSVLFDVILIPMLLQTHVAFLSEHQRHLSIHLAIYLLSVYLS